MSSISIYWIIFIVIAIASWIVSSSLERKFEKYSKESLPMTGRDVALKMLRENGIDDDLHANMTALVGKVEGHMDKLRVADALTDIFNLYKRLYGIYKKSFVLV